MSTYDEQIEELKIRAGERDSLRYPEAFRKDAVELVETLREEDWTQKRISESLEIPWATLGRWCKQANGEDSERPDGFRPVEVVRDQGEEDGISLVSPNGWRIEGLSLTEVVEVARRLG